MYSNLKTNEIIEYMQRISLHWEVPVFTAAIYVLWVLRNNKRIREKKERELLLKAEVEISLKEKRNRKRRSVVKKNIEKKSGSKRIFGLHGFIFLHNMVMSVFSMIVFKNTFFVVWNAFWNLSFEDFVSDPGHRLWNQLSFWIWLFYISKYYEIIDTAILFMSNKESSFLQMYHHAGAIVACWLVSLAQSYSGWVWVVLNSFIHSVMYLYYALTVFGFRPPFKRVITFMQIGQFFTGFGFGCIYIFNPKAFHSDPIIKSYQIWAIVLNIVYVAILTGLFISFERQTYRKGKKSVSESVAKPVPIKEEITSVVSSQGSSAVLSPA
ncbi:hypothetical protein NEOKW01_1057 [Nematocida sp. AWRm80]|nr:hypothetical protein NEOKW01_1057 [Nematocida sp. AWRm80]